MPFYFFYWTPETVDYVAEHDVSREEFEEVVSDPDDTDFSCSTGNPIAFGWTSTGRYLCCVYRLHDDGISVEPVTAYEIGN